MSFTPLFERLAWYFCSYELLCRSVECIFLRYPNLERWYFSLYSVPRAYARGWGWNPLSLIFYKNFITCAKEI